MYQNAIISLSFKHLQRRSAVVFKRATLRVQCVILDRYRNLCLISLTFHPILQRFNRKIEKYISPIHNKCKYFHIIVQKAERQTGKSYILGVRRSCKRGSKSLTNQVLLIISRIRLLSQYVKVNYTRPWLQWPAVFVKAQKLLSTLEFQCLLVWQRKFIISLKQIGGSCEIAWQNYSYKSNMWIWLARDNISSTRGSRIIVLLSKLFNYCSHRSVTEPRLWQHNKIQWTENFQT